MLSKILALLQTETCSSIQQVADTFHISVEQVVAALQYMEAAGYISSNQLTLSSQTHCGSCHGCQCNYCEEKNIIYSLSIQQKNVS